MPIKQFRLNRMPERVKRHIALRDLATQQATDDGKTLSKAQANARAKELSTQTLPHTQDFWNTHIKPNHE